MKLDILAFGAHPDDVELGAGGTIAKEISAGKKVAVVDLTRGEMGSRGTPETRDEEAAASSKILGLEFRANLGFRDCFFYTDENHLKEVVCFIRQFKPDIVLANAIFDRHPDHQKGSTLVSEACFLSGLRKFKTEWDGVEQEEWRPKTVYHFIQDRFLKPDVIIDISDYMEIKMNAVKAYKSQFYNPDSQEPETAISTKSFLEFVVARAIDTGRPAGFDFAEGFTVERVIGADSLFDLK